MRTNLKGTKKEIGDLLTARGFVIEINQDFEAVLTGETCHNNTAYATIFPAGKSPSANADIDWGRMNEDVKITARGGSYASEMFDCILEVL
jgi:hypothetical protein